MKKCSICSKEKTLDNFSTCGKYKNHTYYRGECKECNRELQKINGKEAQKKYRSTEKYRIKRSEKRKTEEYRNQQRKFEKEKRKKNPKYRLIKNLRSRIRLALFRKKWFKNNKFKSYIGCDLNQLKIYIERQFQEGMTWENYGEWHIDHIIPLDSANTVEKIYNLCHYRNLQPLWAEDNIKKSNKVTVCWQKVQRDRLLDSDIKEGFPINLNVKDFTLSIEVLSQEHKEFIKKYEWLGTIGFRVKWCFTADIMVYSVV